MDINDLTIGQAKELAALFSNGISGNAVAHADKGYQSSLVGRYCIIRSYASGVFFGRLEKHSDRIAEISDCRRLWSWKAKKSISLTSVAIYGIDAKNSKLSAAIDLQTVFDCLEFLPVTTESFRSITDTPEAAQS